MHFISVNSPRNQGRDVPPNAKESLLKSREKRYKVPRNIQVRKVNSGNKSNTSRAMPGELLSTWRETEHRSASSKVRRHWLSLQEMQPFCTFLESLRDRWSSGRQLIPGSFTQRSSIIIFSHLLLEVTQQSQFNIVSQPFLSSNTRPWIF